MNHNKTKYAIRRDDNTLFIRPCDDTVKKFLTYTEKSMEKQGWKQVTVFKQRKMYIIQDDGITGIAFQGIWKSLKEHLEGLGHEVTVEDMRKNMLVPDLTQLGGLRFSQHALLLQAIMANTSGLIGAPTRYGKSYLIANMCKAYRRYNIVVTAPGVDLVKQLYRDIKENTKGLQLSLICTGSKGRKYDDGPVVTVCSMDSLHHIDAGSTDLLLIDEPHAAVTDSRIEKITAFYNARKIGFGATLKGRYDNRDREIEAIIGPVIANRTYEEAVKEGAISPLKVLFLKVPFRAETVTASEYNSLIKQMLTQSSRIAETVKQLNDIIPPDWQTMLFIRDEKQADFLLHQLPEGSAIAMAKKLKAKERDELTAMLYNGDVYRCLASKIYIQGVTFPELRVLVNLAGGGANTGAIQKPGRLLQIADGKNYGIMVDIMFECENAHMDNRQNPPYKRIVQECWARHKAYKEIGYDVNVTGDINELKALIEGAYDE